MIEAALAVARRDGLNGMTARSVATELGGSTSVIYGRFASIEELQSTMVQQVVGGTGPKMAAGIQEHGLKAVVRGMCQLGEREPWLLQMVDSQAHPVWSQAREALAMMLGTKERFAALDQEERLALVTRVTIPAVGLVVAAATGELTDIDAGYEATVEPVICHVLATRPRDNLLPGAQPSAE